MTERVAIVGSRSFSHFELVRAYVRLLPPGTTVITGGARGVDTVAAVAARRRNLPLAIHPAEWGRYGRSAGAKRNQRIVDDADRVVAFWDGKSPGTLITIELARKAGKPVQIVSPYDNEGSLVLA